VRKHLIAGALALLFTGTAFAQDAATLDLIRQQLASLNERVGRLEQDNAQLRLENVELKAANDRLDATSEYLKDNASATRKQLAQDSPKVAEAERIARGAEWASRLSWKADLRYRHEVVDPEEAVTDQTRDRIRARLAMTAKINDTLTGTIGIATGGGASDPRSTNQTLGDGWSRKQLALDQAYVDWKPTGSFGMSFGKMPQPWFKPSGFFWDADMNPEGIAARYSAGPFFAHAFGYWLSERSTADDATLLGGQLGMTGQFDGIKLTGALGYFDVGSVQGEITATSASIPCASNGAFFGGPQGNTTFADTLGCSRLQNDYNMFEAVGLAEFSIREQPVQLFAQAIQNQEVDDLDTGWLAGFVYGKAGNPKTWDFGYAYGVMEKDAQFGQFFDSDFGGGVTDVNGSVFRFGYAPAKNWLLQGTYLMNNRFVDAPGATERSYDRYQVDLNWKF
jgi:hypothetical protein